MSTNFKLRLIDEWGRFDQSIVDAAIAASGTVISALVAVERGTQHFFTVFLRNCKIWYFCV